jgi:hypothetical protein
LNLELSDDEDNKENEPPITILPYDNALTPWADPEVSHSDLCIHWEDRTGLTATYCGLSYEYFIVGPLHALRFIGLTHLRNVRSEFTK